MLNRHFKSILLLVVVSLVFGSCPLNSREPSAAGMVPVHMVVTAEARHGGQEPDLKREGVQVYLGRTRAQVADWVPLRGEHAGLELFLLLDDASDVSLGSQLEDLRQFTPFKLHTTLNDDHAQLLRRSGFRLVTLARSLAHICRFPTLSSVGRKAPCATRC